MDDTTQTVVEQQVQETPVNPATAKVSDAEAQRKTAITIQIFYSFCYLLIGIILAAWGFVAFYYYQMGWTEVPKGMTKTYATNSMLAMGSVGIILFGWGIISTSLAAAFQIKNRTFHHISNGLGWLSWITLNPASYNLIRHSNGYLSKKEKKKLAAKAAAANSDDSIDPSAQQN